MRTIPILAVLVSSLLMSGCGDLVSLHPLYNEQDCVLDAALEGRWENDDAVLTVAREGDTYTVTYRPKSTPSEEQTFEMRLVDIGGVRFADILPANGVLGHMFLKVRVAENELRFAFFDSEWLRQRVPHEDVRVAKDNRQAVLIERTPELRKTVEKYAQRPEACDDEILFRRAPARAAAPADEVTVQTDPGTHDTTYSIAKGNCRIRWVASGSEVNRGVVRQYADCALPFPEQVSLISKLMSRFLKDAAKKDAFRTLSWGRLFPDGPKDTEMAARLAEAAKRSPQWDAARGLPKTGDLNGFVRKLANEASIHAELREAFRNAGLDIEIASVEKVLVLRAGQLPFFDRLSTREVKATDRLPFDCQTWFKVSKLTP